MKYTKVLAVITVILIAVTGLYALIRVGYARAGENIQMLASDNPTPDDGLSSLTPQEKLVPLTQKAIALTSKAGWVFMRETTTYDTDRENNGVLPNGNVIPKTQILEYWFHVNEEGLVFEGITSMFSADGKLIQISIFKDNSYWNSATDKFTPQATYSLGALDGGLTSLISEFSSKPSQAPETFDTQINGRNVSVFTIYDDQIGNVVSSDYKQPTIAVRRIDWVDEETGLAVQRQKIVTLADGTQRTFANVFIEMKIGSEPSEDVISQIEKQGGK